MKKNRIRTMFIVAAVLTLVAGGLAMAHDGWGGPRGGYGGHMMGYGGHMMGPVCGGHMMGYGPMMGPGYGSGYGGYGDLSQEEYEKLEAARDKFFDETRELRRQLDEKRYDIQKELAKENPDRDKITALQSDVSKLRSEFDEKALDHRLEVRDIVPESARGGRGYARGYGGGGYCW